MKPEETAALIVISVILLAYFTPPVWVLFSRRSEGGAKFGWFILTIAFSWVALGAFLILTKAPPDEDDDL